MIYIREAKDRNADLMHSLLTVWESSVRATHLFLTDEEIKNIKQYVPQALREIPHLLIVESEDGAPVAFAGIDGHKLEMLFVSAENRGKGVGRQLLKYTIDTYAMNELAVNEQNPQAIGFYEHMGFQIYKRSETDGQGNPYPILYMRKN